MRKPIIAAVTALLAAGALAAPAGAQGVIGKAASDIDDRLEGKAAEKAEVYGDTPEAFHKRVGGNGYDDRDRRGGDRYEDHRRDDRYGRDHRRGGRASEVTCFSRYGRYQLCSIDLSSADVVVSRWLGTAHCRRGYGWDYHRGGIWVNHGCGAVFEIRYRDRDHRYDRGHGWDGRHGRGRGYDVETVTCSSYDRRYRTCSIHERFTEVRLVDQYSNAGCHRGRDWGTTRSGIWVDNGCRARFAYVTRGRGGRHAGW